MDNRDTRFGKLIDLALKVRYGEGFQWKKLTIKNEGGGNYIVQIESASNSPTLNNGLQVLGERHS